ncbi:7 transmembrane receptor domain-containing protein [Polypterus senegalus]|uniref:7 transmembrane receptor domain-containing protein n=1 Tax=Polypterus senegalus TaxID=55291 RepID=UPI0019647641|nr:7 transmembrane receptor domain-containing protein [Polypterus senegalus]
MDKIAGRLPDHLPISSTGPLTVSADSWTSTLATMMDTSDSEDVNRSAHAGPSNLTDPIDMFAGLQLLLRFKPLFIPLYSLLVVVACIGNAFLLACIMVDKKLHNATNFFIGNLSAADLLMCLSCVPLTASYAFEARGWLFGRFMCHFVALIQAAMVYVSVLSLTAIAVDRYVVVAYPIRKRITLKCCGMIVVGIWLLSLCLAAPPSIHTSYLDLHPIGHDLVVCEEFWMGYEKLRLLYSCLMLLMSYMIPLLSVIMSYCAITMHLKHHSLPGAVEANQAKWNKKKRKTFMLLVTSVLAFALCWLPLQILNLIRDLDGDFLIISKNYVNILQVSCHLVAMSSSCYNPFIYASLHHKFRVHLRGYLRPRPHRHNSLLSLRASRYNNTCLSLASEPLSKDAREGDSCMLKVL